MAVYSKRRVQATAQIAGDVFVVVWSLIWFGVGRWVDSLVRALATPSREVATRAAEVATQLRAAGDQMAGVPGGTELGRPFAEAAGSLDALVNSANQQVATIELVATATGVLTFAIPFLLLLLLWLPRRIRFVRASRSAQALGRTAAGTELLALRALTTQPLPALKSLADDPVAAWRAGDPTVIAALARTELRRLGVIRRVGEVAPPAR